MPEKDLSCITQLPSGNHHVRIRHAGTTISETFATEDEAIEGRDAIRRAIARGEVQLVDGMTLRDLGPTFLGSRLGHRSYKTDELRWNKHVKHSTLAAIAVKAVEPSDALEWLNTLKSTTLGFDPEKHGKRPEKTLAWESRRHCLNLARRAFDFAIGKGLIVTNPLSGVRVVREDGDEDEGWQDTWFLDAKEQARMWACWDKLDDQTDRDEKLIAQVCIGSGIRRGEAWCLHLADLHVDGHEPHIYVRFGSWDPIKERYRSPKGRRGDKKPRIVPLFGIALDAARLWVRDVLPRYASENTLGLAFPTETGRRRDKKAPRSWGKVTAAFGVIPRIGRKPWWHLLRHSCATSMLSGLWGLRWPLEHVSKVLGHTSIKTTERYAKILPSVVQVAATRAHAAWTASVYAGSTAISSEMDNPLELLSGRDRHRTCDIRLVRPDASAISLPEIDRRGRDVDAIVRALQLIASGRSDEETLGITVDALERGLALALAAEARSREVAG